VPYESVRFRCAGINHQAWFTEFRLQDGTDLYPRLREAMKATHLPRREVRAADDRGEHSDASRGASIYEGAAGVERVRTELMAAFGYFHTESSHHASEYVPYFRKSPELVGEFIRRRWDYYEICAAHDEGGRTQELLTSLKQELRPSVEYGAMIVNAIETNQPTVIYGNVPNGSAARGGPALIANLPDGCCVELACLVDANGVQPTAYGALPPQCAALNRTNVNVQELAVRAALTGDKEHVYHAVQLDPLTGALLTLEQIRAMTDELFAAHSRFLGYVTNA
jgi:alpha-galactosidase